MRSLLARIALFSFLSTAFMVVVLVFVINHQIFLHFSHYVSMYHGPHPMMGGMGMQGMMGQPETEFLTSLRNSMAIALLLVILVSTAVSYYLARNIARPIIRLNQAVNAIAQGQLDITVPIRRNDEIGQLAKAFNAMAATLKSNTILRQRFLAGVAHELRTPLAILKANLEGVSDGVIEPTPEQMLSLTEEIDRLTHMVDDLRDLAMLEAGQTKLNLTDVNPQTLLDDLARKIEPLIHQNDLCLTTHFAALPPLIQVDPARFTQMIYNLLINAVKYTDPGGIITLSASVAAQTLIVSVADTGQGIAAKYLPHLFDHFYRVDPSRSKRSGGTGLGLAIVRQLAQAHGGEATATSIPGKGSTFSITLPLKAP